MAKNQLPSPEVLRQLLRYEPETGKLFWRERGDEWFPNGGAKQWNAKHSGAEAFTALKDTGYTQGGILGQHTTGHRVVWAIMTGEWPPAGAEIDHENGVRSDNRWDNLSLGTKSDNMKNAKLHKDNRSGRVGVCEDTSRGKWKAQMRIDGISVLNARFDTMAEAVAARDAAEKLHGFHPNHGRAS